MSIELLRDYELDGITENCVKWECSCGNPMIIPFQRVKIKQISPCPECGCCRSFSAFIIEKFENEIAGKN